jgi:hypothetical protein
MSPGWRVLSSLQTQLFPSWRKLSRKRGRSFLYPRLDRFRSPRNMVTNSVKSGAIRNDSADIRKEQAKHLMQIGIARPAIAWNFPLRVHNNKLMFSGIAHMSNDVWTDRFLYAVRCPEATGYLCFKCDPGKGLPRLCLF